VATPSQVRMRGGTEVKTLGGEVDDEEDGDDGPENRTATAWRRIDGRTCGRFIPIDVDGGVRWR
jgi:hypothetical protein